MGMYHSTYFAYGVHVPPIEGKYAWAEAEHVEAELPQHKEQSPDVGYLTAGDYDEDFLFLTTECTEVDLGQWEHVTPQSHTPERLADWDRQLAAAVEALGYSDRDVSAPGWLCIPDLS